VFALNQEQQDFVIYKPEVIKYVTDIEMSILSDHELIVTALKNRYLTVKEIHQLFFDKNLDKHTYTLKTVYKHLEKLEIHDLVTVAGHRKTPGSRVTEKLYSRTAHLFYPKYITETTEAEHLRFLNEVKGVRLLLSHLLATDLPASSKFEEFYKSFKQEKFTALLEILNSLADQPEIADFLGSLEVEEVNIVNDLVTTLALFLRNPDNLDKFREFFRDN